MKKLMPKFLILFLSISVLFYACDDDAPDPDNDKTSAEDMSTAESFFNDIHDKVDRAAQEDSSLGKRSAFSDSICADFTVAMYDTANFFPVTIVLDFGDSNRTCWDGKERRGRIIAMFSGRYRDSATVVTVTLDNYYVDDNNVQGTKTITNGGRDSDGNLYFSVQIDNGMIITTDNDTILWSSTRTNTWVEGDSTLLDICDDVYHISGTSNGTNRNGKSFSVDITKDLRKEICCKWLVSGTIEITPEGKNARTFDFGDGTCDDQATITIAGQSFDITMK
ncbi:MAG: hypothetical protein JKY33_04550 [Bacteroidia bacterium]|nr:hypothetical protein [Bacteroidia bacterium]